MKKFFINPDIKINKALSKMTKIGEKCLIVVNEKQKLLGTLSDGDCRYLILKKISLDNKINKYFNKNPIYIYNQDYDSLKIKKIFIKNKISIIPVVDKNKVIKKLVHLNDILNNEKYKDTLFNNIKIVIMSGGFGTRLKPFTEILPKALIPVNDEPIIKRIINNFSNYGAREFYVSVNFKASILKAYFKTLNLSKKINFINEKKPLGTIGSLSLIKDKIKSTLIVTNCDILINYNYEEILKFHINKKFDLTIVATKKKYKLPYGSCIINNKNILLKIEEKPEYNFLINSGLYLIEPTVLKYIKKNSALDFDNLIKIIQKNKLKIGVFPIKDKNWYDVGQWQEYFKTIKSY